MFKPLRQIGGDPLGIGGQAGTLEEGRPERLPAPLGQEVVLEPAEPLAVLDREVARPQSRLWSFSSKCISTPPGPVCRRSSPGPVAFSG